MARDDEKLRDDLRRAYGSDLPGERFTNRVLGEIEEPGGRVREMAIPEPSSRRPLVWLGIGLAAAVAIFLAVLGSDVVTEAAPEPEEADSRLAGPPEKQDPEKIELPESEVAEKPAKKPEVVVYLDSDGKVRLKGKIVTHDALKEGLRKEADKHRADTHGRPSTIRVLIRTDRRTPWRQVQWVMQACGDPKVRIYKLSFAATRDSEEVELPVPLPIDRGLMPTKPGKPRLQVKLVAGHPRFGTRIECVGEDLGHGEEAWLALQNKARAFAEKGLTTATLDAGATVPHEEAVLAIDILYGEGYESVLFVGAPPPRSGAKAGRTSHQSALLVVLRVTKDGTVLEHPAEILAPLDQGLETLVKRLRALRDAGLKRRVTLEIRGPVQAGDTFRVRDAVIGAGFEIDILHED